MNRDRCLVPVPVLLLGLGACAEPSGPSSHEAPIPAVAVDDPAPLAALVTLEQRLEPDGPTEEFGTSVGVSGDLAVVSALAGGGAAYVFQRSEAGWTQIAELSPTDATPDQGFGSSAAINGNLVVVGAFQDDEVAEDAGAAYVFDGTAGWSQVAKLTAADGAAGVGFGIATRLSGNLLVVGMTDPGGPGAAYVFDGAAGWTQVARLTAADGAAGDRFGQTTAISGDRVLIGALGDDDNGEGSGSAYVFDGAAGWAQVAKLVPSDGAIEDLFGRSVGLSGTTAIVGASGDDDNGLNSGSAYVFDGSAGWTQVAKLTPDDGAEGDNFGSGVAVSGSLALIGAGGARAVYVFDATDGWTQETKLEPDIPARGYGFPLAISGRRAAAGAPLAGDAVSGFPGAAWIYDLLDSEDDTDGDGLSDGDEVELGTDPFDPDTDGDDIPDGSDPDILGGLLDGLPDAAFGSGVDGHRTAFAAQLATIQDKIASGRIASAIRDLQHLRRRVDGCGAAAEPDDWIEDCASQIAVRDLIDSMIAALGG